MGGGEKGEGDNGCQNSDSQKNNETKELDLINEKGVNLNNRRQPHILVSEKSYHNSSSVKLSDKIDDESAKKDIFSRKASVDSTEDSGEWDDPELISFLPHFLTIENQQAESRIQFSVRLYRVWPR